MNPAPGWRFWRLMRPYRTRLLGGVVLAFVAAISAIGLMAVAGWFIAAMALAGMAGTVINYFTPAAFIRACAILRTGGRYGERLATHDATLRSLVRFRTWLLRRLIPLAPAQLSALRSAELMTRLRADVDALEHFYIGVGVPFAVALLGVGLVLLISLAVWPIAAYTLLIGALVAGVLVPLWLQRRAATDAAESVREAAALRGLMLDALRGHAELMVWGQVARHTERIMALDHNLAARRRRLDRWQALGAAVTPAVAQWTVLAVLVFGANVVHIHDLGAVFLVMLSLLSLATYELVAPLSEALTQWTATVTAAGRVFELADTPAAIKEPARSAVFSIPPGIRFRGVSLRYRPDGPWALKDVNLSVGPGARVAIVGASGAGKTSLLCALQKLFVPEGGSIEFGGTDVASLRGDDLRQHVAVIAQNGTLFNRSLRDNLLLAAPGADVEDMRRAVHIAQLDDFVRGLPQGYDTVLGETGALVSGGEVRRIAIAQALLKDAPVLILDEPTEGLDAQTANDLLAALEGAARGRTVLLVTHRLSGLSRLVDEVVVLRAGRIQARMAVATYEQQFLFGAHKPPEGRRRARAEGAS